MNCRNKDVTALFFFVFYQRSRTLIGQNRAVGGPMRSRFVMQISRPTIDAGLFYYYYYFLKNRLPIQSIRLTDDLHVSTTSSVTWLNYFLGGNFHFNQGKKKKKRKKFLRPATERDASFRGICWFFFFLPLFPFSFFFFWSPKKMTALAWKLQRFPFVAAVVAVVVVVVVVVALLRCGFGRFWFDSVGRPVA